MNITGNGAPEIDSEWNGLKLGLELSLENEQSIVVSELKQLCTMALDDGNAAKVHPFPCFKATE